MYSTKGFTLLELLIAITASLAIAILGLSVYRQAIDSNREISSATSTSRENFLVQNLIQKCLSRSDALVSGNSGRLCLVSDLNILGYGAELICFSTGAAQSGSGGKESTICIYPMLGIDDRDENLLDSFVDKSNRSPEYEYCQKIGTSLVNKKFEYIVNGETMEEVVRQKTRQIRIKPGP